MVGETHYCSFSSLETLFDVLSCSSFEIFNQSNWLCFSVLKYILKLLVLYAIALEMILDGIKASAAKCIVDWVIDLDLLTIWYFFC